VTGQADARSRPFLLLVCSRSAGDTCIPGHDLSPIRLPRAVHAIDYFTPTGFVRLAEAADGRERENRFCAGMRVLPRRTLRCERPCRANVLDRNDHVGSISRAIRMCVVVGEERRDAHRTAHRAGADERGHGRPAKRRRSATALVVPGMKLAVCTPSQAILDRHAKRVACGEARGVSQDVATGQVR